MHKEVLRPERVRRIPEGFGWVDHRLVRHGYVGRCGSGALALYLFLVTVGDENGLSYYSDQRLCVELTMTQAELTASRTELVNNDLIAWRRPLYQVLDLAEARNNRHEPSACTPMALGDILRAIAGGVQ